MTGLEQKWAKASDYHDRDYDDEAHYCPARDVDWALDGDFASSQCHGTAEQSVVELTNAVVEKDLGSYWHIGLTQMLAYQSAIYCPASK